MGPITMEEEKTSPVFEPDQAPPKRDAGRVSDSPVQAPLRVQKDIWDKIAAVAPIISGTLIFAMGGYFTYSYNQQQLRVQEIQTIEKFIPHLMGNDQSKRAAILAISSLTNAELAGKFAQIFASKGTVSALQSIAETGSESDRSTASTALAKALENIEAHESKLNELETAFQQAISDKAGAIPVAQDGGNQISEADRLEHLADMCRGRGQLAVAESLLKQAVNIRLRVQMQVDAKDVVSSLKKLAEVEQAQGNKDESENLQKKIALIEAKYAGQLQQGGPSSPPPPPPPPAHETANQSAKAAQAHAEKVDGENAAKEKELHEQTPDGEAKGDKESTSPERDRTGLSGESAGVFSGQARAAGTEPSTLR